MLDLDRQRPWAEDEIARTISVPGDVRDSLRRLRACKLIHRWNDLAVAAHAAVRFHEITQPADRLSPGDASERHWDKAVLEGLLARSADGEGPRTAQQTYEAFGARKQKKRLQIDDRWGTMQGTMPCRRNLVIGLLLLRLQVFWKWARQDSNLRPTDYESAV